MKEIKWAGIDTEFCNSQDKYHTTVAMVISTDEWVRKYWIHNTPDEAIEAKEDLLSMREEYTFIAHQVVAEARTFLSLGLNPVSFKWFDTQLEYRNAKNQNNRLMYGTQLIGGEVIKTTPPKRTGDKSKDTKEKGKVSHQVGGDSLANVTYKLLGKIRDTEHKTAMRNLIISAPDSFKEADRRAILDYCAEDVEDLVPIKDEIFKEIRRLGARLREKDYLLRGEYGARTAVMKEVGYYVDMEAIKAFTSNIESIISEVVRDILRLFPSIKSFKYNKKTGKFSKNTKVWKEKIKQDGKAKGWPTTDTGSLSLALDAFRKVWSAKDSYPEDNWYAQIIRYLIVMQNVSGFREANTTKRKFWDFVGSDDVVRPYMNIFGSQTSRSQPKATGFIPAKTAWMRSFIVPPKGKMYVTIDYGSEEFLISALLGEDKKMYEAYTSGDVYMAFAKSAGAIPPDGKREDYKLVRQMYKAAVLGIGYGMGAKSLAGIIRESTGDDSITVEKTQEIIDSYSETYWAYDAWRTSLTGGYVVDTETEREHYLKGSYYEDGYLQLPDNWYMWGDNPVANSIKNFPVQGTAASIMRKAVALSQDAGLDVSYTLHDALYILADIDDWDAVRTFRQCMKDAFTFYFKGVWKKRAGSIKMDIEVWGYPEEKTVHPPGLPEIKCEVLHIEDRAKKDYAQFSKYFHTEEVEI